MENKGMKITVLGGALIVAAVIAAVLLVRYLNHKTQGPTPPEGSAPGY